MVGLCKQNGGAGNATKNDGRKILQEEGKEDLA